MLLLQMSLLPFLIFLNRDLHDTTEFTTENGQTIIAFTNRIRTPGWGVAVTITQSEILQSFYDSATYGGSTFCDYLYFINLSCLPGIQSLIWFYYYRNST